MSLLTIHLLVIMLYLSLLICLDKYHMEFQQLTLSNWMKFADHVALRTDTFIIDESFLRLTDSNSRKLLDLIAYTKQASENPILFA